MNNKIYDRVISEAKYIISTNKTIREVSCVFGVSKSTVHKDLTDRLTSINHVLAIEVRKVLDENKEERHIRGGLATKHKYEKIKKEINNF